MWSFKMHRENGWCSRFQTDDLVLRNFHSNDLVRIFRTKSTTRERAENDLLERKYGTHACVMTILTFCKPSTETSLAFCVVWFSLLFFSIISLSLSSPLHFSSVECVSDDYVKICHMVWCATRVPLYCFRFSNRCSFFTFLYRHFAFLNK